MKRIFSLRVIIPFAALLLVICIYSCKDNPLVPPINEPYQFDSARYEWRTDSIDVLIGPLKVFDKSNIYLLSSTPSRVLMKYDGINFITLSHLDITTSCLDGFDDNNLYVGGADLTQQNYGKPRLKKWNGSSFQEIEVPNPENRDFAIANFLMENPNEIWMCSGRGDIFRYDIINNSFESQRVDTSEIKLNFLKDEFGNYYCYGYSFNTFGIYFTIKVFKKEKNKWNWINVYSKDFLDHNPYNLFSFNNNELLAIKWDGNVIYKFEDINFNEMMIIDQFRIGAPSTINGSSINDFIITGFDSAYYTSVFHSDGKKFSRELEIFLYSLRRITKIADSYLLVSVHPIYYQSVLYFGKPKN
jgi:hypothetical protein